MIGERIAASRRKAGLSQQKLAIRLGIHVGTISYYERGAWPVPPGRLAQIAEALDDPSLLQANDNPETLRAK